MNHLHHDYSAQIHHDTLRDGRAFYAVGGPGRYGYGWVPGGSYKGTQNWAVIAFFDKSKFVPLTVLTTDHIQAFIQHNAAWLNQTHYERKAHQIVNDYAIGTRVHDDHVHLDIVQIIPDNGTSSLEYARELARQQGQLTIYNLGTEEEVTL